LFSLVPFIAGAAGHPAARWSLQVRPRLKAGVLLGPLECAARFVELAEIRRDPMCT